MKNSTIREVEKLEKAMEADPPVILWVLHPVRKVMVAAHVYDPHADRGHGIPLEKCAAGHRFDEENTITRPDGSRECRSCKRRRNREYEQRQQPRETDLLAAARTPL
jgi:hypothetical protein